MEDNDGKENNGNEKTVVEIKRIVTELSEQKEEYERYVEELEGSGERQKSPTDPDSRLLAAKGKLDVVVCPMGRTLYPGFYKKATGQGIFYNREACKHGSCTCTKKKRGRRHQVPMAGEDFSKFYNRVVQ